MNKKNICFSGKGDIDIFLNNLKKFEINKKRLKIDNRLSTEVKKIDILNNVNPSRFFHIDGGHDYETVLNDIKLATEVTLDEGIIAIDDVFRPEWPEVSMAVFQSEELEKRNFACFAIGFNKSYYCNKKYFNKYQEILLKNKSLTRFLEKKYISKKYKVLIFQDYPLPEWNYKQIIWWFLKTYIPNFYLNLKKFLKK